MVYELKALEKCLCCGADIPIPSDAASVQCAYCHTRMSVSNFTRQEKRLVETIEQLRRQNTEQNSVLSMQIDMLRQMFSTSQDGRMQELFRQGEEYQRQGDFSAAIERYEVLLKDCPNEAEVHWRIMLCRYGIEYVREQTVGRALPTLTRMHIGNLENDASYQCALRHAPDEAVRKFYQYEVQRINRILMKYQHINGTEAPYDVFISVKQGNASGQPTADSDQALKLYDTLTERGWKVFNSRVTLKQYSGTEYEPHIMHALSTAKVLIVMASTEEYMNAPWVRNEWRRFRYLQLNNAHLPSENQRERRLIAYILGDEQWSMPELGGLQIIRADSPAALNTLTANLRKVCGEGNAPKAQPVFPNMQGMTAEQMKQFMEMFAAFQQMQASGQAAQPVPPVQSDDPAETDEPVQSPSSADPAQTDEPVQSPPLAEPAQTDEPVQSPPSDEPVQIDEPVQMPSESNGVEIGDAALEQALRETLGKTNGEPITTDDLAGITALEITGQGVSDISPLRHCTALTELRLYNNQISDISPLSHCTALTELFLWDNQISDISPLRHCTALLELELGGNQISDISPLAHCTALTELELSHNRISDISPLRHCTALSMLYLSRNRISDISPLRHCTALTELYLESNQISDISPLISCTNLKELNLQSNPLPDGGLFAIRFRRNARTLAALKNQGCTMYR